MTTPNPERSKIVGYEDPPPVGLAVVTQKYTKGTGFYYLTCDCPAFKQRVTGKLQWCDHIEHTLECGIDAPLPKFVIVPLFRKPACQTAVHIESETSPSLQSVYWAASIDQQEEMLGYIGVDEGRSAVRMLVLDYLRVILDGNPMRWRHCNSPTHSDEYWSIEGNSEANRLADVYFGLVEQKCAFCSNPAENGVPVL